MRRADPVDLASRGGGAAACWRRPLTCHRLGRLASIHRPDLSAVARAGGWFDVILAVNSGMGFLPLTCSAACPGFRFGVRVQVTAWGRRRYGDRSGLVRPQLAGGPQAASNKVIHCCSRCQPSGRCKRDVAAAVPGGAGGDVDQVAAEGRAAGSGVGEAGQGSGGAQQVVRDGGAGQPGGVRWEEPGWQVSQRPVGPVGEDLLRRSRGRGAAPRPGPARTASR